MMLLPSSTRSGMRLRTRMILGFSAVLALIVILTAVGIWRVDDVNNRLTQINDVNSVKQRYAIDYRGSVHDRAIAMRDALLVDNSELGDITALIDRLTEQYRQADTNMIGMRDGGLFHGEDNRLLQSIEEIRQRAMPLLNRVLELRRSGDVVAARALLLTQARPAFEEWLRRINAFIDHQESLNQTEVGITRDITGGFRITMLLLCTVALLLGGVIATLLTRHLMRTLGAEPGDVRELAAAIGRGELNDTTSGQGGRRVSGSIMAALEQTAFNLRQTVISVKESANLVADASARIDEHNSSLSRRTEQQASALEESAASMDQLGSTVGNNSESARDAEQLATSASDTAERGGRLFGEVETTMKGIDESARQISDIIGMIDEIAFQTNLLALNASVEAARAGEHGRGFAVVAQEVRNLASRSATASREINELISGSVKQTEQGARLVTEAGATIREVVDAISRVQSRIAEISRASVEQSSGVNQVCEAIGQLDQTTQHNATMVEQSARDARELHAQAQVLLQSVAVFRLESDRENSAEHLRLR